MKRKRRTSLLAHAVIVLVLTMTTLFILDLYNPFLGFMSSTYSRILLCSLFLLATVLAVRYDILTARAADGSGEETETAPPSEPEEASK